MPHTPWPEEGCALAEARERTVDRVVFRMWRSGIQHYKSLGASTSWTRGDSIDAIRDARHRRMQHQQVLEEQENYMNAEFRRHLTSTSLIAYGRPGNLAAEPQLIAPDIWSALSKVLWDDSAAGERRRGGVVYLAVRVFPVLLAPNRLEFLDGLIVQEAFKKYVINDPEVVAFGRRAIAANRQLEQVFVQGACYTHGGFEWPLAHDDRSVPGTVHSDPKRSHVIGVFSERHRADVMEAIQALAARYRMFLGLLRRGELTGHGIPAVPGHPPGIPRAIWSHDDYYFKADSGDIMEANPECEDPPRDFLLKRWSDVELRRAQQAVVSTTGARISGPELQQPNSDVFHVKPTSHDELRPDTKRKPTRGRKSIEKAKTSRAAEIACTRWLAEIMSASRHERTRSNDDLWRESQQHWPRMLSKRAFERAKAAAISRTGATAWAAAGAPKKSPHQNRRIKR
jgi:hypothetical protein